MRTRSKGFALLLAFLLAASACGGGDDDAGVGAGENSSGATTTAAGAGSDEPAESVSFQLAMGSPGLSGTLIQEALVRMNEKYGHDGEFVEIADSDLVVQGAAQGQFQMGSSSTASVMKVIQNGAPLKFIGELARNQWTLQAKAGIENCADIDGKRLGLHSPGGVSTALYRAWYQRNCDGEKPDELYIEGSPNRFQALLADQVDVSMIEVEDAIDLPEDGYTMLANFSKELSDIKVGLIYANQDFIDEHPDVVEAFMTELTAVQQEVNDDPAFFEELARTYEPDIGEKTAAAVEAYIEGGLIPDDGGFTEKDVESSIALYVEAGTLDGPSPPGEMMDRSFLEKALETLSS